MLWADILANAAANITGQTNGSGTSAATGGTIVGASNTSDLSVVDGPDGRYPRSFALNGTSQGINTGISLASLGTDFTVGCWARINAGQDQTAWDNFVIGAANEGLVFFWGAGTAALRGSGFARQPDYVTATAGHGPNTIPTGEWHHLAVQKTGGLIYTCIDGNRIGSGQAHTTFFQPNDTVRFGYAAGSHVAGRITGCQIVLDGTDETVREMFSPVPQYLSGGSVISFGPTGILIADNTVWERYGLPGTDVLYEVYIDDGLGFIHVDTIVGEDLPIFFTEYYPEYAVPGYQFKVKPDAINQAMGRLNPATSPFSNTLTFGETAPVADDLPTSAFKPAFYPAFQPAFLNPFAQR
jgi:hypothetical protein